MITDPSYMADVLAWLVVWVAAGTVVREGMLNVQRRHRESRGRR